MYDLRKKMSERDEKIKSFGKSADTMKLDIEIKDKFQDLERSLGSMNEVLRRQSKNTKVLLIFRLKFFFSSSINNA